MSMDMNWNFRAPQNTLAAEIASQQARNAANMRGYQPLNVVAPQEYRPNALENPQATPDLNGYGASREQASMNAAREERIASLTSQIKELEDRIASNEAQLKGWTGPANEIAALEAEKINTSDPTSIWRWKADKDESRRIAAAEKLKGTEQSKANAMYEINNSLSAIRPNAAMDSGTQQRYFQQLADLKTLAQKNGLPTDAIDAKIREVEGGKPEGEEQTSREKAKTDWKGLKNKPGLKSIEIKTALNDTTKNWDPDERKEAENLAIELGKKEAAAQDVKNMKAWAEKEFGKKWDTISPRMQETYKRLWNNRKGMK